MVKQSAVLGWLVPLGYLFCPFFGFSLSRTHVNENRDAQFKNMARLDTEYKEANNPIISFDTKKKEVLGNLYRPVTLYTKKPVTTFDRDFWSFGHGILSQPGVYDSQQNREYITLINSKDTRKFACDALRN
ncbi:ISAzo13-like element transposase-related protein [Microcoleus asticus]|uniref:Uncharacterized protein n=1 Tax=Microcoleus asticus IPMA8 TaxID=2563858 RepID=A0ABX2D748_9CYAN|nr:hypothetical protein [Microcoleus asticus]NQE38486.1 hypothetical protein [Microcoleus asticus IPMA8]